MSMPDVQIVAEALRAFDTSFLTCVDGVWVNQSVQQRTFKYYIFDWDDNIIFMPTRIHLERKTESGEWMPHYCSTSAFSAIRSDPEQFRPPQNNWELAFVEFQDSVERGGGHFIEDLERALDEVKCGLRPAPPSFNAFRKTLIEGRLFAIVTARGHSDAVLRHGVALFIERALTPVEREIMLINLRGYRYCFDGCCTFPSSRETLSYYLDLNRYTAVTSPRFNEQLAEEAPDISSQEDRKRFAIGYFVDHVIHILEKVGLNALNRPISVGFSDDDPNNISAVESYVKDTLARRFPEVKFCVYDASDVENGTRKVVVSNHLVGEE